MDVKRYDVDLAIKLSKAMHDMWVSSPHGIGIYLAQIVHEHTRPDPMSREDAERLVRSWYNAQCTTDAYETQSDALTADKLYKQIIASLTTIPRPDPADIDDTFWKDNQDKPEECYDPMAQAMRFIDNLGLLESLVVSTLDGRKKIYNILKTERKQIVIETMNRFSDICSMIDAVREEGEGTYEACKRLIDTNSKCPDPAEVERLVDELIKASGYYSQIGSSSLSKKREKARADLLKLVGG